MITLHARTKADGYTHPARWEYIKVAKQELSIPVCGNGDITTPQAARDMLEQTGCDHLMIGRQAARDPLIFHKIRATSPLDETTLLLQGLETFFFWIQKRGNPLGSIKQLASFLLTNEPELKKSYLTTSFENAKHAEEKLISLIVNRLTANL